MIILFGTACIILIVKSWAISLGCNDGGTTTSMQFNVTCDNYLSVYVDGNLLGEGETHITSARFHQYKVHPGSHVIALRCKGKSPPFVKAIIGSLSNGVVTDNTWKCTNSFSQGWNMRNYPDESWPMAASYGTNSPSTLPWGYFEGIEPKAAWIWTNDNTGDVEVYCRRNIVFPCTKVKYSFFQPRETNEDIALQGFLLRQVKVASDIECGLRCSQYACASFTVQQLGSRGPRSCELYTESATSKPTSVIKRTGFRYYERIHVYH